MTIGDILITLFMIVIFLAMCIAPSKLGGKGIGVKEKPEGPRPPDPKHYPKSKCSCGCDKK